MREIWLKWAAILTFLGTVNGVSVSAQEASRVVITQEDSPEKVLLKYGGDLDSALPEDKEIRLPSLSIREARIISIQDLTAKAVEFNDAFATPELKHFYILLMRMEGGFQLIRLDIGGCSLAQVSKWVQEQRDGHYKSGVTINGEVHPIASYKLTNGEFVDVHALEVSNIGINDNLKCQ